MRTSTPFSPFATRSSFLLWAATTAAATGCSLDADNPRPAWADAGATSLTQTAAGGGFVSEGFTYDSKEDCLAKMGDLLLILDRDGDGATAWWHGRCNDFTQLPTGYYRGNVDCDDTDPTVFQQAWRDADGDGWTTGDPQCLSGLPEGYRASRTRPDCDDSNADLNLTLYADKDGDGFGVANQPSCVAQLPTGATLLPGTSLSMDDCNDDDASVHPGASERWRDGVDGDCDGKDDPLLCSGPSGDCGCELLGVESIPIDSSCAGPDLFLAKQVICEGCGGRTVVSIGNRGSGPAESVAFSVDGEPFPGQGRLEPGAVTLPIILPYSALTLAIASAASECNTDNNVTTVSSSAGICDP